MATEKLKVYRCPLCVNMVEVVNDGGGTLSCCGQPMEALVENTTDAAQEKHVPVIEQVDGGVKVTVGSVSHPMQEDHWIEWIELTADGKIYRQALQPGDAPQAVFAVESAGASARALCNQHGLWKA